MKHIKETNNKKKNSTRKKESFRALFLCERYTIYGYKEKIISQNKRDYKGTVI